MKKIDKSKSLESLENDFWEKLSDPPTGMVLKIYKAREKPLNKLTNDELRLLITQNIGLRYLIPIALEVLRLEPLAEAMYYPGDLLQAVLNIEKKYWFDKPDQKEQVLSIINDNEKIIKSSQDTLKEVKNEIFFNSTILMQLEK